MAERGAAALLLGFVLSAWVGCGGPSERGEDQWPLSPAELGLASAAPGDAGERAYLRTCIACHGADGKGNGATTAADFTTAAGPLEKADDELLRAILEGTQGPIGVMPPHRGLLGEDEAHAVLAYLRQRFGTREHGEGASPDQGVDPEMVYPAPADRPEASEPTP